MQEGHRVEFEQPDDPDSKLVFKGVVFNEMKGAMSSPVSVLWQAISEKLYPTTTYHYNSGGEPADIPKLSYQQLKDFYRTHYHPSNAVFMTFGNIPAAEHQAAFEALALSKFDRLDINIHVDDEQRFIEPVVVEDTYAYDAAEGESIDNKTHHVLGWLLGRCTSLDEMMKANLLSQVLLDNSSSPLRKALETTDLGSAPSPLCGLEDSNHEMCFLCGLEGSQPEQAQAFEDLVLGVLRDVADNGVPQEQLEAVLHQLELGQREIGGDGYPYGLQLILGGLSAAIHRSDPVALLDLDPVIASLREQIRDPDFIKCLVRKNLLDNRHRVRMTMKPDTELSQRKEQREREVLDEIRASMSEENVGVVIRQAAELARRQKQQDDPEILPKVGLEDVPAEIRIPVGLDRRIAGTESIIYEQGTNGLVYHEVVLELPAFDADQLDLLPDYSSCLTELGVGDKDYLQVQTWQSSVCGDVFGQTSIRGDTADVQTGRGYYLFAGKALDRNNRKLAELMSETAHAVRFDEHDRIRELISQKRARKQQSITGSGHTLAMTAASSGMSPVAQLSHRFNGLESIRQLQALDDANRQGGASKLAAQFEAMHSKLLSAPRHYMVIAEAAKMDSLVAEFESVWQPASPDFRAFELDKLKKIVKQMWVTNTQVNFCARAYPTVPMEHPDAAALTVLGGFLRNGFLHTSIREQGGAYGGGAGHDTNIAAFRFFSYRDPRLTETLADFDRAIEWLLESQHEWRQVEEAILGIIGSIDKPASPAGEARQAYHNRLHGRSPEQLQAYRQAILKVTLDDLQRVARTYLDPAGASTAVITSAAMMEQVGDLGLDVIRL